MFGWIMLGLYIITIICICRWWFNYVWKETEED